MNPCEPISVFFKKKLNWMIYDNSADSVRFAAKFGSRRSAIWIGYFQGNRRHCSGSKREAVNSAPLWWVLSIFACFYCRLLFQSKGHQIYARKIFVIESDCNRLTSLPFSINNSYHLIYFQGATISAAILSCISHPTICTDASTPLFFIFVSMCFPT